MNDAPRSELFTGLADLSRHYPHWRMGQLVANLADWAEQDAADAIDYAEWMIYDAQLAVLDALDARAYADERARIAGT